VNCELYSAELIRLVVPSFPNKITGENDHHYSLRLRNETLPLVSQNIKLLHGMFSFFNPDEGDRVCQVDAPASKGRLPIYFQNFQTRKTWLGGSSGITL
jgi:hypothetical protein